MENRTSSRRDAERSIVCSYFTSQNSSETFDGKVKNCCDSGMYAELATNFKIGTILVVRSTSNPGEDTRSEMREAVPSISLAEVKWSKRISANGTTWYGTGFRYLVV
jgi:hypothetical protein